MVMWDWICSVQASSHVGYSYKIGAKYSRTRNINNRTAEEFHYDINLYSKDLPEINFISD